MRDLPRKKPRLWSLTLSYQLFRVAGWVLPADWLARRLLNIAWISHRLAYEQVNRSAARSGASIIRPYSGCFLRSNLTAGERVLDYGGGPGNASRVAAEVGAVVTYVDKSPENAKLARKRCEGHPVEVLVGDGTSAFEHGPFDTVLMLHVLEHLDDPAGVLSDLRNHTSRLLVELPDFESNPLNHARAALGVPFYTDADHVSEFNRAELLGIYAESGWQVEGIEVFDGAMFIAARH